MSAGAVPFARADPPEHDKLGILHCGVTREG
jgi:hypothetical protein